MNSDDPFDDLLNLEEQYYQEGFEQGRKDGIEAGRLEGYSLGLRKGFEKFVEAGRLQSKAMVWANRIPNLRQRSQTEAGNNPVPGAEGETESQKAETDCEVEGASGSGAVSGAAESETTEEIKSGENQSESTSPADSGSSTEHHLPSIRSNPRLEKNIETLYGLVEPGTFSMENDDESVNDFDSRMKGAQGKLKLIERAIGEGTSSSRSAVAGAGGGPVAKNANIEEMGPIRP